MRIKKKKNHNFKAVTFIHSLLIKAGHCTTNMLRRPEIAPSSFSSVSQKKKKKSQCNGMVPLPEAFRKKQKKNKVLLTAVEAHDGAARDDHEVRLPHLAQSH